MSYLKARLTVLLIAFLCLFPTLHTFICYGGNPSSKIVDNVYSSVVVITHTEIKTSVWDILSFASLVAGTVMGTGGYGAIFPGHLEKAGGTGFQTKWGVVTNSHVMEDKPKVVLTTFHNKSYSIDKTNKINCKNQTINIASPNTVNSASSKSYGKHTPQSRVKKQHFDQAVVYDWGGLDIDLALIGVKIPDAVELPLAKEVKIGEKVFTLGHPKWKEFTPAVGSVRNIFYRKGIKQVQLRIKNAPGCSGSPVLNIKGEVVGLVWGGFEGQCMAEAVHVDELRKAFGLPVYDSTYQDYPKAKSSRPAPIPERGILAQDVVSENIRQDLALEPDDRIMNITSPPFTADVDTMDEFWRAWRRIDKTKTCRFLIKRGANFYDVKFIPDPLTVIQKAPQVVRPWNGPVYSTRYSQFFHRPDCDELISGTGDLIEFSSKERAMQEGGILCPECNP